MRIHSPFEVLRCGRARHWARETGIAWHATLQQFVEDNPSGALPSEARESLLSIARTCFGLLRDDPAFALHWPNIEKGLDFFLAFERKRAAISPKPGSRAGRDSDSTWKRRSFELRARADRIRRSAIRRRAAHRLQERSAATAKEVKAGFSPQLTLEAAMLRRGGFEELPRLEARKRSISSLEARRAEKKNTQAERTRISEI